jgi:putative redox protein
MSTNRIDVGSERDGDYPVTLRTRGHVLHSDLGPDDGAGDSAPSPHDYFDASLAACKAMTAMWYAKRKGIPLERVETRLERDDADERKGVYRLTIALVFHGAALTAEHRSALLRAAAACPIHKLMTTIDVQIDVALAPVSPT